MFLDPEPKKQRHTMSSSGFFASRLPIESPRDQTTHRTALKRRPLHERSKSQNNSRPASIVTLEKPTVRLIQHSSSPNSSRENSNPEELQGASPGKESREGRKGDSQRPSKAASKGDVGLLQPRVIRTKPFVSDTTSRPLRTAPSSLRSAEASATSSPIEPPTLPWHRRSCSSGVTSDTSTLYLNSGPDGSLVPGWQKITDEKRHSYGSLGTTLRGTPTPYEQDLRDREDLHSASVAHPLHTLPEVSPERTEAGTRRHLRSESSEASFFRSKTSLPDYDDSGQAQHLRRKRKSSSLNSLPSVRQIGAWPATPSQAALTSFSSLDNFDSPSASSPNFIAYNSADDRSLSDGFSEGSEPYASSPNFIAFSSPATRPKSTGRRLQGAPSFDSIESRLHHPSSQRDDAARDIAYRNRLASGAPSSTDTLPPIYIPKKSAQSGKDALFADTGSLPNEIANAGMDSEEEIDTLPYPRQAFSTHLSTIASESDRTGSRHWSHFSSGSGVLTGDESSDFSPPRMWQSRSRTLMSGGLSRDWIGSSQASLPEGFNSDDEAGDTTIGIYREESAKPLPLFKQKQQKDYDTGSSRQYHGPMPPMPPIPWDRRDSEEDFDQVTDLYPSRLRAMRSGQSLRQRSNSTPSQSQSLSQSHSRAQSLASSSSSDRPRSNGSGVFPFWAKQYYGHGVALMSPSKVSLSLSTPPRTAQQPLPQRQPQGHLRGDSEWTDITATSRLGTSFNDYDSESMPSSHFLPSIFRPRTRTRVTQENSSRTLPYHPSQRSQPSSSRLGDRVDSMGIVPETLAPNDSVYTMEHSDDGRYGLSRETSSSTGVIFVPAKSPARGAARPPAQYQHQQKYQKDWYHQHQHRQERVQHPQPPHPLPQIPSQQSLWIEPAPVQHPTRQVSQLSAAPTSSSVRRPRDVIVVPHGIFQLDSMPHLHTTARSAAQGLQTWRAPSFVDSLDSLLRARGNRQILLFVAGFLCPFLWILGAILPIPEPPDTVLPSHLDLPPLPSGPASLAASRVDFGASVEDINTPGVAAARKAEKDAEAEVAMLMMLQHQAEQEAHRARWAAEKIYLKAQWWRTLNRIMSVVGVGIIGAIIALAVVAGLH